MDDDLIEVFALIVMYNGYEDLIEEWRTDMHKCDEELTDFHFGDFTGGYAGAFEQGQVEFLLMILVIIYGEYGTSPRSGWITNPLGCSHFLDRVMYILKHGGEV